MVDRFVDDRIDIELVKRFNLVIEILMVDRSMSVIALSAVHVFQSRNRDSYG